MSAGVSRAGCGIGRRHRPGRRRLSRPRRSNHEDSPDDALPSREPFRARSLWLSVAQSGVTAADSTCSSRLRLALTLRSGTVASRVSLSGIPSVVWTMAGVRRGFADRRVDRVLQTVVAGSFSNRLCRPCSQTLTIPAPVDFQPHLFPSHCPSPKSRPEILDCPPMTMAIFQDFVRPLSCSSPSPRSGQLKERWSWRSRHLHPLITSIVMSVTPSLHHSHRYTHRSAQARRPAIPR